MSQPPSKAQLEKQKATQNRSKQISFPQSNHGRRHNSNAYPLNGDWYAAWNTWSYEYNDDYYQGRLYTSFDPMHRTTGANRTQLRASYYEKVLPIEKAPERMKTEKLTIKAGDAIMFSGNRDWLSTFYPAPINIDGHQYPTCEHYYQACKLFMLAGPACAMQIRHVSDAGKAKQMTRQLLAQSGVTREKIEIWKYTHGLLIVRHAMRHKFIQHSDLQEKLLATNGALLLHIYAMDKVFATGCDTETMLKWLEVNDGSELTLPIELTGDSLPYYPHIAQGKNILGILAMRTRQDCLQLKDLPDGKSLTVNDSLLHAAFEEMTIHDKKESSKENQAKNNHATAVMVQKKIAQK